MKTYEVKEVAPMVYDLVNIENVNDRFMCAEDQFTVGALVNENEFKIVQCNYIDEQGNLGVGPFAVINL